MKNRVRALILAGTLAFAAVGAVGVSAIAESNQAPVVSSEEAGSNWQ